MKQNLFILLKKYSSHAVMIKNSGISNNFISAELSELLVFTRLSSTFLQAGLFEKRIKSVRERGEGGEYLTRFLWKYLPPFFYRLPDNAIRLRAIGPRE